MSIVDEFIKKSNIIDLNELLGYFPITPKQSKYDIYVNLTDKWFISDYLIQIPNASISRETEMFASVKGYTCHIDDQHKQITIVKESLGK
jgi:hypothetical protein